LRLSLGASRGRLIRQLVTESLALAAIGGVAAIAVAYVLPGALVRMLAESDPRFHMSFLADPLVLAFVLAATVGAALLFGVLPAWQVSNADAGGSLVGVARNARTASLREDLKPRFFVAAMQSLAMILRETTGTVGAGLALGGGMAYAASRLIDSRLYGVAPQDPLTLAVATGLLLLVALGAAYVPAVRASRVDPMTALRHH
jgi:ABC-type antimicrobial peptide transport system permease subunit